MTITLSIDCMGGDHGPSVIVPAAVSFLAAEAGAHLILVGKADAIQTKMQKLRASDHPRISIVNASEVVTLDDPLEVALRRKKDSSMRVAINLVKDGRAHVGFADASYQQIFEKP